MQALTRISANKQAVPSPQATDLCHGQDACIQPDIKEAEKQTALCGSYSNVNGYATPKPELQAALPWEIEEERRKEEEASGPKYSRNIRVSLSLSMQCYDAVH